MVELAHKADMAVLVMAKVVPAVIEVAVPVREATVQSARMVVLQMVGAAAQIRPAAIVLPVLTVRAVATVDKEVVLEVATVDPPDREVATVHHDPMVHEAMRAEVAAVIVSHIRAINMEAPMMPGVATLLPVQRNTKEGEISIVQINKQSNHAKIEKGRLIRKRMILKKPLYSR